MSAGRMTYAKQAPTPGKVCVDCLVEHTAKFPGIPGMLNPRPAPHPGPRCHTHHNAKKRNARIARKVKHVERTYGLNAEQYDALYAFQGGRCALCRRATGASKRLAVDHDHAQAMRDGHAPNKGCPNCVRGLVCSTCNDVLAHFRSDPGAFERGAAYLREWPWRVYSGHHE